MVAKSNYKLGYFSVFGVTSRNENWLTGFLSETLGIEPKVISYPNKNLLFCYTNHGDIVENDDTMVLKLGFVRSAEGKSFSPNELLDKCSKFQDYERGAISGNGLLVNFHKREPKFTILKTFMATTQIFYASWQGGIFCSTDLRALLMVADQIKLNEKAVPLHFLYRFVPGPMTYFDNIRRVFPGEILIWNNNDVQIKNVQNMYTTTDKPEYDSLDSAAINTFFKNLSAVMNSYIDEIGTRGGNIANQLSGGVDSSIIQLMINQRLSSVEPSRSFTWKFEAESFKPEVEYAKEASALLGTQHVYLDIYAREYPNLLTRTIETLAQPNIFVENCPGELALTEFLSANYPERQYIFFGQGADGFHGLLYAPRAAIYSVLKNSVLNNIVESAFTVLSPIRERKLQGLLGSLAIMLRKETYHGLFGPKTILDPIDRVGITFYIMEIIRHYWGDTVLKEALEYVCNLAAKCYHSGTMLEKLQSIDIVTFEYDPTVVAASLASTNRKVLIPFYFDQEVIRLAMNFTPDIRYLHKGVTKPILKAILTQKSLEKLAQKKKLWSGFNADLCKWMRSGVLKEMVHSIERPNFMNKKDFNDLIENKHPDSCELLWPLLTYDIFQKCISTTYSRKGH